MNNLNYQRIFRVIIEIVNKYIGSMVSLRAVGAGFMLFSPLRTGREGVKVLADELGNLFDLAGINAKLMSNFCKVVLAEQRQEVTDNLTGIFGNAISFP